MAKQIITTLIDDLDGKSADESLTIALDGVEFAIDLSSQNAAKLRSSLAPYLDAAQRVGRVPTASPKKYLQSAPQAPSPSRIAAGRREKTAQIRAWAERNKIPISDRGRIPREIEDKYDADISVKPSGRKSKAKIEPLFAS